MRLILSCAVLAALLLALIAPQAEGEAPKNPNIASSYKREAWLNVLQHSPDSPEGAEAMGGLARDYAEREQWGNSVGMMQRLASTHPKSVETTRALCRVVPLLCNGGQEDRAVTMLVKLTKNFPEGPYFGRAYISLIDIHMIRRGDLETARHYTAKAVLWARARLPKEQDGAPEKSSGSRSSYGLDPTSPAVIRKEIYLRAGMLAYLNGQLDLARDVLKAGGEAISSSKSTSYKSRQQVGVGQLLKALEDKVTVTTDKALAVATTEPQRTLIRIGNLLRLAGRHAASRSVFRRVLTGKAPCGPPSPGLEAYCIMRIGRLARSADSKTTRNEIIKLLKKLYEPKYAEFPWTASGIVALGLQTVYTAQSSAKAMAHYEYVFKRYPDSSAAEEALYRYCRCSARLPDKKRTESTCRNFLSKYPESEYGKEIGYLLKKVTSSKKKPTAPKKKPPKKSRPG